MEERRVWWILVYCHEEDMRIATLVMFVDDILFAGNYKNELQGMVDYLGVPYKLLGVTGVNIEGMKLDQVL